MSMDVTMNNHDDDSSTVAGYSGGSALQASGGATEAVSRGRFRNTTSSHTQPQHASLSSTTGINTVDNDNNGDQLTGSPMVLNDQAVCLLEHGRYDDAMELWIRALQFISASMSNQEQQNDNGDDDGEEDEGDNDVAMMDMEFDEERSQEEGKNDLSTSSNFSSSPSPPSSSSQNSRTRRRSNDDDDDDDDDDDEQQLTNHSQHQRQGVLYFDGTYVVSLYKRHRHIHNQVSPPEIQGTLYPKHLMQDFDRNSTSPSPLSSEMPPAQAVYAEVDDHDDGERFFLSGPLLASSNIELVDEGSSDLISFMLMFNVGLCWHLQGLSYGNNAMMANASNGFNSTPCSVACDSQQASPCEHCPACIVDRRSIMFSKAVELYKLARCIIVRGGGTAETMITSIHFMGLLSNMQHAYMMIDADRQADECNALLLQALMFTIDQKSYRQGTQSDSVIDRYADDDIMSSSGYRTTHFDSNIDTIIAETARWQQVQLHHIEQVRRRENEIDLMNIFIANVLPRILDGISSPAA